MHLLVRGAFWRTWVSVVDEDGVRLNAPSGARCFLAKDEGWDASVLGVLMHLLVRGAFWHDTRRRTEMSKTWVLMHLLVRGAFWRDGLQHLTHLRP